MSLMIQPKKIKAKSKKIKKSSLSMVEMLRQTERQGPGQYQRLHDDTVAPSLDALGLTKRESAEAKMLASLPTYFILSSFFP